LEPIPMDDYISLFDIPKADKLYMIAGWRQWADAGSISSGLPKYLIQKMNARKIGAISPEGFYLFQIPGTHDLVRPVVKFKEGFPEYLQKQSNEFFFSGDQKVGLVIFLGDEPHLDAERYISAFLYVAKSLDIKRIVGVGGVYGELPYNKERMISSIYSHAHIRTELNELNVNLSDYQGGASIGSYLCKKAIEENLQYVSFYGFVPTYNFSMMVQGINGISIENDFMAWLGILRRIKHMLDLDIDLSELELKSENLIKVMDDKIDEIEEKTPDLNVREYLERIDNEFEEKLFHPREDFWEEQLGRLFDNIDSNGEE
jgi:proteasome assembly chaperone (PAC2) family protein